MGARGTAPSPAHAAAETRDRIPFPNKQCQTGNQKAPTIHAELTVPGDKSISHRAIMLAALANGPCDITRFSSERGLPVHR